jgi:hypothetical protein
MKTDELARFAIVAGIFLNGWALIVLLQVLEVLFFIVGFIGLLIVPTLGVSLLVRRAYKEAGLLLIISGFLTSGILLLFRILLQVNLLLPSLFGFPSSIIFIITGGIVTAEMGEDNSSIPARVLVFIGLIINTVAFLYLLWTWMALLLPYYALVASDPILGPANWPWFIYDLCIIFSSLVIGLILPLLGIGLLFLRREKAGLWLILLTGVVNDFLIPIGGLFIILAGSLILPSHYIKTHPKSTLFIIDS